MASTQDLKRRVRSISNTRKLTRAMELVASARLRRAQQRIEAMRPYADRMLELMAGTAQAGGAARLPLLERRETSRASRSCRSPATAAWPAPSTPRCCGAPSPRCARRRPPGRRCASSPPASEASRRSASAAPARASWTGLQRQAGLRRRPGDRARRRRRVRRRRGRPRAASSTTPSSRRSCSG